MELVLLKDVKGLGKAGSLVKVKDGYAANMLLPKGLAAVPRSKEAQGLAVQAQKIDKQRAKDVENRRMLAKKYDGKTIQLKAKVGSAGRLFGSVTTHDVAQVLNVDKKFVILPEPIRALGVYPIVLSLGDGLKVRVNLQIVDSIKTS